jgi:4-hydroxy-3-methylbut-2-enyl diphosphate reductase
MARYRKLKDIPGSKTIFVALAWGIVTALLPPLAQQGKLSTEASVAFLFSAILVFIRSTLYDFKDIQGDLMVGKETIPIVLGKRKSENLVVALLFFLGGVLSFAPFLQWATAVTSFLLASLGYVVAYYFLYQEKILGKGFLFEGVVDGSFIFSGLLAFLWSIL